MQIQCRLKRTTKTNKSISYHCAVLAVICSLCSLFIASLVFVSHDSNSIFSLSSVGSKCTDDCISLHLTISAVAWIYKMSVSAQPQIDDVLCTYVTHTKNSWSALWHGWMLFRLAMTQLGFVLWMHILCLGWMCGREEIHLWLTSLKGVFWQELELRSQTCQ